MKKSECPNCFQKTWNGKKCTNCGATSTGVASDARAPYAVQR